MCDPGLRSAHGAQLLEAFQYLEGFAHDVGTQHPPASGRTGRGGIIGIQDFATALRTYLPDKVRAKGTTRRDLEGTIELSNGKCWR